MAYLVYRTAAEHADDRQLTEPYLVVLKGLYLRIRPFFCNLMGMKFSLFFLALLFTACRLFGQSYSHIEEAASNPFLNDANGRPLYLVSNYTIEGSPYFIDEYKAAQLVAMKGTVYNNVKVKINLVDRLIQYIGADGKEMITDIPVKKLVFADPSGGSNAVVLESFYQAMNVPGAAIYQVLDSGSVKLLKKIVVNSRDEKKYGNAGTTRVFEKKETYYSMDSSGSIKKLEKGKAAMLDLFAAMRDALAAFIDQQHLGCRSEQDYKAVFRFCNSF